MVSDKPSPSRVVLLKQLVRYRFGEFMALTLRLQRHGATHRSFFHIVATDSRNSRDGRFIEKLGYYDPNKEPSIMHIDAGRAQYWYEHGAQLSGALKTILKKQKIELKRPSGAKKAK